MDVIKQVNDIIGFTHTAKRIAMRGHWQQNRSVIAPLTRIVLY